VCVIGIFISNFLIDYQVSIDDLYSSCFYSSRDWWIYRPKVCLTLPEHEMPTKFGVIDYQA
jgi:hypothetical protein